MTIKFSVVSVSGLQALLDTIAMNNGTVSSVCQHPYQTDGFGAKLLVIWSEPS
jgi:hypothetical protein